MSDHAKKLVHTISNKMTTTIGFLDLASDGGVKKDEYLTKARAELWAAVLLMPQLARALSAMMSTDPETLAAQAKQDAEAAALLLEEARKTADDLAAKAKVVADQLAEARRGLNIVAFEKPKKKK